MCDLKMKVKLLETNNNDAEQRSKNYNIILNGVPETPDENTSDFIVKIAQHTGSVISRQDIDTSHRLKMHPNSRSKHRPIVVRFIRRDARQDFLRVRKSRSIYSDEIGNNTHPRSQIFINEHRTKNNMDLYRIALELKRSKGYKFVWSSNGIVKLRKNENSEIISLTNPDMFASLV